MAWMDHFKKYKDQFDDANPYVKVRKAREALTTKAAEAEIELGKDVALEKEKTRLGVHKERMGERFKREREVAVEDAKRRAAPGYESAEDVPTEAGGLPLKTTKVTDKGKWTGEYGYHGQEDAMSARALEASKNAPPKPNPVGDFFGGIGDMLRGRRKNTRMKVDSVYQIGKMFDVDGTPHQVVGFEDDGDPILEPVNPSAKKKT